MFSDNKYTKTYYQIIAKAQGRPKLPDVYYENHHIVPRSLGGDNTKTNLIYLTSKEHFICHLLLVRMTTGDDRRKMAYAMWNLSINKGNRMQNRDKLSAKSYEMVRNIYRKESLGAKRSEEVRQKLAANLAKHAFRASGVDNPEFCGYYVTPWGKFATRKEAEKACPYGINYKRIATVCKDNTTIVKRQRPITIPKDWIGLTHKEIGFSFEPA